MEQPGWKKTDRLEKVFTFHDFNTAINFINRVAERAEAAQHHPNIELYDYKKVRITLYTHSAQKITEKDIALAHQIDAVYLS